MIPAFRTRVCPSHNRFRPEMNMRARMYSALHATDIPVRMCVHQQNCQLCGAVGDHQIACSRIPIEHCVFVHHCCRVNGLIQADWILSYQFSHVFKARIDSDLGLRGQLAYKTTHAYIILLLSFIFANNISRNPLNATKHLQFRYTGPISQIWIGFSIFHLINNIIAWGSSHVIGANMDSATFCMNTSYKCSGWIRYEIGGSLRDRNCDALFWS